MKTLPFAPSNLAGALVTLSLFLVATLAQAIDVNFEGGVVAGCNLAGTTYTCSSVQTTALDGLTIAGGYVVNVNADVIANAVTLAIDSALNANLTTSSTLDMAASSQVNGHVVVGTTMAMAENSFINGDLEVGSTLAIAQNAYVLGNVSSLTTISYATRAYNVGTLTSGTTIAMAADTQVFGNIIAGTTLAIAAGAQVFGDITAGTTFSMAAGGFNVGNVFAGGTVILAAGAHVFGDVTAGTTVTMATGAFVQGLLTAPTVATLANNTCYGSIAAGSITDANTGSSICNVDFTLPAAPVNPYATALITSAVPEPRIYALFLCGLGLVSLVSYRRRSVDADRKLVLRQRV